MAKLAGRDTLASKQGLQNKFGGEGSMGSASFKSDGVQTRVEEGVSNVFRV